MVNVNVHWFSSSSRCGDILVEVEQNLRFVFVPLISIGKTLVLLACSLDLVLKNKPFW